MEDSRDLIGETVLVKLTSNEGLAFAGVPGDGPFFCRVAAVDEIGIWLENKNFATIEIRNSAGCYIPKRKQKARRHAVNLLIPWRIIHTVVKFEAAKTIRADADVLGEKPPSCARIGFVEEGPRRSRR
jgi:hypothetical protein